MTRRMVKVMSAVVALSIATTGVVATAGTAAAAAPAAAVAQATDEKGVLIVAVQKDGPAAQAGLRRGDIVLKVNGVEVNDAQALRAELAKLKPGDEAEVRIARGDGELQLKIALADADGRAILGVTPFQAQAAVEAIPAPAPAPRGQQMDPKQAEELRKQLEEQFAAMSKTRVTEVSADSPAAEAGLKQGDLILAVDGTEINAEKGLAEVVQGFKPGDEVTLKIERDGAEQELKVTLGENPDKAGAAFLGIRFAPAMAGMMQLPGMRRMPGAMPLPMPGREGERGNMPFQFELPEGVENAAVVGQVVAGSPAEAAGLKQGDLITAANDKAITTPQDIVALVQASKPGDEVTLSVRRQGEAQPVEITVTLGENPDKKGAAYMGVALGSLIRMERMQPGNEGSFEILPGLSLPFNLDQLPFQFELPQQPSASGSEL